MSSPSEPSAGTAPQYGVWHQRCPKCGMNRLSPNVDKSDLFCDECGYSTSVPVSDPPSAGTARPDAAPNDEFPAKYCEALGILLRIAQKVDLDVPIELRAIAEEVDAMVEQESERKHEIAWLRSALAEREATILELRTVSYQMLDEIRTSSKGSISSINNVYLPQIGVERVERWSAAVAPAAREPTTETSDGE